MRSLVLSLHILWFHRLTIWQNLSSHTSLHMPVLFAATVVNVPCTATQYTPVDHCALKKKNACIANVVGCNNQRTLRRATLRTHNSKKKKKQKTGKMINSRARHYWWE